MHDNTHFGIGIIGCGTISDIQAEAIRNTRGAVLSAVYSRTESNAKRVGKKFDVPYYTDWDAFINQAGMVAVSVCTPSGNHLDYGALAAKAGKHVIVEKPIEVTVARSKQLIDICRQNNVKLAVIFQNRFLPETISMKKSIENGDIGKIFQGDAYIKWFRSQEYYDSASWRGTMALDGGGVLINQAIHTIDLLIWNMGDVKSVYAQTSTFTHERLEGEDVAVAVLRFENGAVGIIEASTSIQPASPRRLEIHGTKGTAILNGDVVNILTGETDVADEPASVATGADSPLAGFSIAPHRDQFQQIVDAIQSNQEPPVSGSDALKSVALVNAIYESAKTQQAIEIKSFVENSR